MQYQAEFNNYYFKFICILTSRKTLQGREFEATLDRNHNQNPVYCEVANQFTETLSETGPGSRSPIKKFNVLCE